MIRLIPSFCSRWVARHHRTKIVLLFLVFSVSLQASRNLAADGASRFATVDGNRLHYLSYGRGQKGIVFVHGWSCNATFWEGQIRAFAPKTRVLAIDLPGHGESDKPERAYTMEFFARAVEAVMRDAGVNRAVLVGHSMGTPVVRQFYRLYPKKVDAMVIVDGALRPPPPSFDVKTFFAPLRGQGYQDFVRNFVSAMMPSQSAAPLREQIQKAMLATPQRVMISAMDGMLSKDVWTEDRIEKPVLAIMAKGSWPPDNEAYYRGIAPNLDYQEWTGVGHFLMMEKPTKFNEALTKFLTKQHLLGYK